MPQVGQIANLPVKPDPMLDPASQHSTLDDWISREAIPFSLVSSETFHAALDKLITSLDPSVELLALGESLHGDSDILNLRNRVFQRLVEKHGYTAIALESSFPRARVVNDYVLGVAGDQAKYDAIQETGFSHGFGHHDTTRQLVEWMRSYNAEPGHPIKLHFYGFDSPTEMMGSDSPRQLLHFVLDYLAAIDSARCQDRRQRVDSLLGQDADWENPAAMFDPKKSVGLSPAATALRIETEDIITELQIRRPELVTANDLDRYLEASHYACLARQLLNYHAAVARESSRRTAELLGIRDAMMADNLAYIVSRERGRMETRRVSEGGHCKPASGTSHQCNQGKVLAFAHNMHLQRGTAQWQLGPDLLTWWPAGAHLHHLFGPRYAAIGFAIGISANQGIGPPEPGTLEARLTALAGPSLFIPTHRGQGLPAAEVAALPTRSPSTKNSTYFPLTAQSLMDFDGLVVHSNR